MGSVTLHSDDPGGIQTITITQTGDDTAHIDVVGGAVPSEDVINVRADPAALELTCQVSFLFFTADIRVVVQRAAGGNGPAATITISHIAFANGVHVFPLQAGEDDALQAFLQQAGFPPLAATGV